jgi:hypothetical protein
MFFIKKIGGVSMFSRQLQDAKRSDLFFLRRQRASFCRPRVRALTPDVRRLSAMPLPSTTPLPLPLSSCRSLVLASTLTNATLFYLLSYDHQYHGIILNIVITTHM